MVSRYQEDCLTAAEYHALRDGDGSTTNGDGPSDVVLAPTVVPQSDGSAPAVAVQLCALDGCANPVTRRLAKYCSTAHQRLASRERTKAKDKEAPGGPADTNTGLSVMPAVVVLAPFEQLAAVASILPAGWRLEATASTVVVSWSA
jgi:hypothetical protein